MGYGLEQLSPPPPSTLLQKLILFPPSTHTLLLQSFLLSFFCSPFSPLIPTQNSRCYQSFCHISLCLSCLSFTHPVALVPISFLRHFPLSVRPFLVLYLSVSASSLSKVLAKTRNAARELSFFCKERLATPPPPFFSFVCSPISLIGPHCEKRLPEVKKKVLFFFLVENGRFDVNFYAPSR
jgi:hypothetical protein